MNISTKIGVIVMMAGFLAATFLMVFDGTNDSAIEGGFAVMFIGALLALVGVAASMVAHP